MSQAAEKSLAIICTDVEFDTNIQSLAALEAAAYRLIGIATCQIERSEERFVCHLMRNNSSPTNSVTTSESLKQQYLDLVTDENLRARVATKTDGVRNVIMALAFGALADSKNKN